MSDRPWTICEADDCDVRKALCRECHTMDREWCGVHAPALWTMVGGDWYHSVEGPPCVRRARCPACHGEKAAVPACLGPCDALACPDEARNPGGECAACLGWQSRARCRVCGTGDKLLPPPPPRPRGVLPRRATRSTQELSVHRPVFCPPVGAAPAPPVSAAPVLPVGPFPAAPLPRYVPAEPKPAQGLGAPVRGGGVQFGSVAGEACLTVGAGNGPKIAF